MPREINLRAAFGEPEEVLRKFENRPILLHPTGVVPSYRHAAYQSGFRDLQVEPHHVSTRYREQTFQHGLAATRHAAEQGQLGVFLVHVPRTRYREFPVHVAFGEARLMSTQERPVTGGIVPLYVFTRGDVYLDREDNNGTKYPIADDYDEEENYDCTEAAKQEGLGMGALTVILEKEEVEQQIRELLKELSLGQMPRRRV